MIEIGQPGRWRVSAARWEARRRPRRRRHRRGRADRRARGGRGLGLRVLVVTKDAADDGTTRWAQGGVAVVARRRRGRQRRPRTSPTPSTAGAGLCDAAAVARDPRPTGRPRSPGCGPAARCSTRRRRARLARTREGGHSAFRVVHAGGDATGAEVERALRRRRRATAAAVLDRHVAVDALRDRRPARVAGARWCSTTTGVPGVLRAPAVLLATGGLRPALREPPPTPTWPPATGIALALRAGATVADLEFVQFHPTVLYTGAGRAGPPAAGHRGGARRGRACCVDRTGRAVHGRRAPAGRPRAARRRLRGDHPADGRDRATRLRVPRRHRASTAFAARFPTVLAACRAAAIDPAREPIPVDAGRALRLRRRRGRRRRAHGGARASTPPARWPAPACTGRTGWRPTACSRAWSSAPGRPARWPPTSPRRRADAGTAAAPPARVRRAPTAARACSGR